METAPAIAHAATPAIATARAASPATPRQYYLDWLRVITILVVFFFHCGRPFDSDDWHVKNATSSFIADFLVRFAVQWMMPLFFFISGGSTWYALQSRTGGRFLKDRTRRILVPLIFGIFLLSPHQVYIERYTHGQFHGSFLAFLPHYFDGWYALGGNFAWMGLHLWYLLLLFVFSLALLPLFLIIRKRRAQGKNSLPAWTYWLAALPILTIPGCLFSPDGLFGGRMWGGWSLPEHLLVFLLGYYAFSRPGLTRTWSRYRYVFLALVIILTTTNIYCFVNHIVFEYNTTGYFLKISLRAAVCLSGIFTLLGFASQKLNYTNRFLKYSNQAVLPFYILHQPVIVLVAYFVVQWQAPIGPKYLVIASWSMLVVAGLYAFVVKRSKLFRFLHGI